MSPKLKRLMLVDGNALVHRAFHALPPLTTKKGELVNAVYGFTTLLLKGISDLKPDYVAVAFDLAGPTFRHQAYKEYKATRVKAPDELYAQFDRVKEIVRVLNIPIFEVEGFEADDVIGTLSQQAAKQGIETIIVTGDMDTLQLVNQLVKVYTMRRGITDTILYDNQAVEERYGLSPTQFVDFKALKGDQSDNIPGVDGIGEKTASTLIQGFGSLDALYSYLADAKGGQTPKGEKGDLPDALPAISPRIREILLKGKAQAYQSQALSQISYEVPVKLDRAAASIKDYDRQQAVALFQELEFRSLLTRLPETDGQAANKVANQAQTNQASLLEPAQSSKSSASKSSEKNNETISLKVQTKVKNAHYHLVKTAAELEELIAKLTKAKGFVIDTETDYLDGPVIGLSFAIKAGEAWYVPVLSRQSIGRLDRAVILKKLTPPLEDQQIAKYGHNMKYDYLALQKEGITVAPLAFDTMIASFLLNPSNRQPNLDAVTFTELGVEKIPLAELIGVKKLDSLASVDVAKVAEYACEDADMTLRLFERFQPLLQKDQLKRVFNELEMPLIPILAAMEATGIKIDVKYLHQLSKELTKRQQKLIEEIYTQAGQEFNINSPAQLSVILFEKLKIHPSAGEHELKKTKTGISTAASELEKMRGLHPIIELIFEYRELTKLLSTYINVLPDMVDKNSRLHTSYSQTIAATGRLSSNDPNLQNIPIRTATGRQIRQAFVAEPGYNLVSVDYSQIELRVAAHMAGDETLIEAFQAGRDIHQEVADRLGVDRRAAKTLNFAVLYGQGAYSTAQGLGISVQQAKEYIENYFATYKRLRQFLDSILAIARTKGYVETLLGRRRYIPEIKSSNFIVRAGAERVAMNMPLQGTAADIMKLAMIAIDRSGTLPKRGAKMLLQVHDELVFEAPIEQGARLGQEVKELMETAYQLKVPILAEVKVGPNWDAVK